MNLDSANHAPVPASQERRKRPDLRTVFEDIVHRLEPFFSKADGLNGGPTEYWAARVIHDAHPELTHHDAKILVDAAARYFREKPLNKGD